MSQGMKEKLESGASGVTEDEVLRLARRLASALSDLPEFRSLEDAEARLAGDAAAQADIEAFGAKQKQVGWMVQAGLADDRERDELSRLQRRMLAHPSVQAYVGAQAEFGRVCSEVARLISAISGVNFAGGGGCCS